VQNHLQKVFSTFANNLQKNSGL